MIAEMPVALTRRLAQLAPVRTGRKKRKGPDPINKLPTPTPNSRCKLKLLKLERIKDHMLLEEEYISNQCASPRRSAWQVGERACRERLKPSGSEDKTQEERTRVEDLRGSPMSVGSLEEVRLLALYQLEWVRTTAQIIDDDQYANCVPPSGVADHAQRHRLWPNWSGLLCHHCQVRCPGSAFIAFTEYVQLCRQGYAGTWVLRPAASQDHGYHRRALRAPISPSIGRRG
jgi:hypothetical protein